MRKTLNTNDTKDKQKTKTTQTVANNKDETVDINDSRCKWERQESVYKIGRDNIVTDTNKRENDSRAKTEINTNKEESVDVNYRGKV